MAEVHTRRGEQVVLGLLAATGLGLVGGLVWSVFGGGPLSGRSGAITLFLWPFLGAAALLSWFAVEWLGTRRIAIRFLPRGVDDVGTLALFAGAVVVGAAFAAAVALAVWTALRPS